MAGTISYQVQMRVTNGGISDSYASSGLTSSQATALLVRNVQSISNAAHSALDLGSVSATGYAVFVNLDATNYVEVGIDVAAVFYPFLKLKAGEQSGPVRLGTAAPYAKANTAPVSLFYVIYND